jgi:hypothetical protein
MRLRTNASLLFCSVTPEQPFLRPVVPSAPLSSANVVRIIRMFLGQSVYVPGSLQVTGDLKPRSSLFGGQAQVTVAGDLVPIVT